ncbi:Med1 [Kluyveromyces lactis]|nr:Med1 [Kluyveromyces lactis]
MSDAFVELLDEMIERLLNYKPGSRTLPNVIKLCQTLGLESFVDQVDSTKSRLSIASNIVVIDIDYENEMKTILDVKLVLASNFDKFNYFNEKGENILLTSLSDLQDLKAFHHNLNFLVFLDSFSNIDIESGHTSLDLFKYYTDLPKMLQDYISDQHLPFTVKMNENSTFGISIYDAQGQTKIMTVDLEKAPNSDRSFYEYVYDSKLKDWLNESSDASTQGINLVFKFEELVAFPETWLTPEIQMNETPKKFELPQQSHLKHTVKLQNELTSDMLLMDSFRISNEDIALLPDFLKWYNWHKIVLQEVFKLIIHDNVTSNISTSNSGSVQPKPRRKSSVLSNRRPSMTDSMMLRDSGIPEFTLKEILDQPVISDTEDDDQMDVDKEKQVPIVLNEEYIYIGKAQTCSYNDNDEQAWKAFIDYLKSKLI